MASLSLRETLLNCDYDYRYMHKRFLQLYAFCSTFWTVYVLHVCFGLSTLTVRDSFLAYPYAVTTCRYVYFNSNVPVHLSTSMLDTQGEFSRQPLRQYTTLRLNVLTSSCAHKKLRHDRLSHMVVEALFVLHQSELGKS